MIGGKGGTILGIDWGSKYIGLAYVKEGSQVILPIGYIINDGSVYYNLGDILARKRVNKIIVGYPKNEKTIQGLIDDFINNLKFIVIEGVTIEKIDEDYTTVEAGEIISNFRKDQEKEVKDTISAMKILERYIKIN